MDRESRFSDAGSVREDGDHGEDQLIDRREIERCTGVVDAMIRSSNMEINSIRTKNEKNERDRKFDEEVKRQERYKNIQLESMKAARKNAELEMKWSEFREMEECQELYNNLQDHKRLFQELIDTKKALSNDMSDVLRNKDSEYNKMIEEMESEIDMICESMRNQFSSLRELSIKELRNIEDDLIEQRQQTMDNYQKVINDTLTEHKETENNSVNKRQNEERSNKNKLDQIIVQNEKIFSNMKIQSETEIQNCEKCFEDMKALYQLNAEKLNYNFKVLSEKKTENTQLKSELKKKERFFQNQYKDKLDDYQNKDREFKRENKKLTEDYRRISKRFKDLHKKFKHFKKADIEMYYEVKEMNLSEIQKIKESIVKCDKIIHMQQLGVVWEPPKNSKEGEMEGELYSKEEVLNPDSIASIKDETQHLGDEQEDEDKSFLEEDEGQYDIPVIELNAILNIIIEETYFLLDDKISQEIYYAPSKDKLLLKLNVLRKVLAVADPTEFKKIIHQIYTMNLSESQILENSSPKKRNNSQHSENNRSIRNSNRQQDGEQEEDEEVEEPLYSKEDLLDAMEKYDVDSIILILGNFIEEKKNTIVLNNEDNKKKVNLEKEKREKGRKKEEKFWTKMTKILPDDRLHMWKILDKISSKYYKLLLDRQKLIQETTDLHNQNDELKNLLNQYLNINHNLLVPPSGVINVNFLE